MPVAKREDIECHDGVAENDPRVYVIGGENLRSVTSVLSYDAEGFHYLMEWAMKNGPDANRQRDESALVGNVFHHAAEKMVVGGRVDNKELIQELKEGLSDLAVKYDARTLSHSTTLFKRLQRCLQGLANFWQTYNPKTIASEAVVYSLDQEVAGSLDLQCEIEGVPTIVDFKTSKSIHQSYLVQATQYGKMLWGETDSGNPVENWYDGKQIGILHVGNGTKQLYSWKVVPGKHRNHKDVPTYADRFQLLLDLHRMDYQKVKPKEEAVYPKIWSL